MVRRATVVLSVLGLLWQTAACSSADPPKDSPSVQRAERKKLAALRRSAGSFGDAFAGGRIVVT